MLAPSCRDNTTHGGLATGGLATSPAPLPLLEGRDPFPCPVQREGVGV